MDSYKLLDRVGLTKQSHYFLTSSGLFVNGETVVIGGVTFTFVTTIGTTAGNILIGTAAANLANLAYIINNPTYATTANYVALSASDQAKLAALKLNASATSTVLTIYNPFFSTCAVSETCTNHAFTSYSYSLPFSMSGKMTSLQLLAESISAGNGVLSVEVSNDANNWTVYNRLNSNVTNTNAQQDTRVASVTQSTNAASIVTFPYGDAFSYLRVKIVTTTDGAYSVSLFNK